MNLEREVNRLICEIKVEVNIRSEFWNIQEVGIALLRSVKFIISKLGLVLINLYFWNKICFQSILINLLDFGL